MSRTGKFSLSDFLLPLYWLIYIPDTDGAKEKTRPKCQTEVNQHVVPSTCYDVSKRRKGETPKFLTSSKITSARNLEKWQVFKPAKKPFNVITLYCSVQYKMTKTQSI